MSQNVVEQIHAIGSQRKSGSALPSTGYFRKAAEGHETEIGSEGFIFVMAKPSTSQKMV